MWQPLTFSGVAAFARAPRGRLLLLQSLVAAFNVAVVVLLLLRGWFPVVNKAVQGLGDFGALRNARLAWPKTEAVVLAEKRESDGPQSRISDANRLHFFAGQPLAEHAPIGTVDTLKAATAAKKIERIQHPGTYNANPLSMAAGLAL